MVTMLGKVGFEGVGAGGGGGRIGVGGGEREVFGWWLCHGCLVAYGTVNWVGR